MSEEIDYNEQFSIDDFEDGKIMAMLCYLPLCCCLGYLGVLLAVVKKDNDFHCFHARQGLGLGIIVLVVTILSVIGQTLFSMLGLNIFVYLVVGLSALVNLAVLALGGFGIFQCTKPEFKTLPIIGDKLVSLMSFIAKDNDKGDK
jgi:uncharacterized membrane protein